MVLTMLKRISSNSLYRNSLYLMISTLFLAGTGFFFWIIVAHTFSSHNVGIATALISMASLIANFSLLGLNSAFIRYLPQSTRPNDKINTGFTLVVFVSSLMSICFLLGLKYFSPTLLSLHEHILYMAFFIIATVFTSLNTLVESIFIAHRSTGYVLQKNIILSFIKLVSPLLFIFLAYFGIFLSYTLAIIVAVLLSIFVLVYQYKYQPRPIIYKDILVLIGKFSFANYVASFLGSLPLMLLPIIITNRLGPKTAAYFYIVAMIINLLNIIPLGTTQSLFAEGSKNKDSLKQQLLSVAKLITLLLIPAIIILLLFGKYILLAFGKEYSLQGIGILQLLVFSSLFYSVNVIGTTILNIYHKIKQLVLINLFYCICILTASYSFLSYGLWGIGEAWIISQAVISLYFGYNIWSFLHKSYE